MLHMKHMLPLGSKSQWSPRPCA